MAALKRKLFAGMCVLIGLQVPAMLFGEGRGIFFNATGVLDFAPSLAQGRGETIYGDLVGIGGLTLGGGYNFSSWELSLNTGWGLNTRYPAYDEVQSDGAVIRRHAQIESHEIPLFVKGAYRIGLGSSFTFKPNLFTGVLFSVSSAYDTRRNWVDSPAPGVAAWKLGFGADFAFSFPGEKVSVFAGADFSATFDLIETGRYVLTPAIRGGIVFYPFSRANKYSAKDAPRSDGAKKKLEPSLLLKGPDKKGVNIVAKNPTGSTENTVPVVLVEAPAGTSGNALLAAVRGQTPGVAASAPAVARGQTPGTPVPAPAVARGQTPPAAPANPTRQPAVAPAGSGTAARRGSNSSGTAAATGNSAASAVPLNADDLIRDINAMKADVAAIKTDLEALE